MEKEEASNGCRASCQHFASDNERGGLVLQGQVVGREREPVEKKINRHVDELELSADEQMLGQLAGKKTASMQGADLEDKLAEEALTTSPNFKEEHGRMD